MGVKKGIHCEAIVQPPGTTGVFKMKFCKKPVTAIAVSLYERKRVGLCDEHALKYQRHPDQWRVSPV